MKNERILSMKRKWCTMLSVLFYIIFLAWAWGFDITELLDLKLFFQLLVGAFLLTLPFYQKTMEWGELLSIFGKKALEAGYIQTFLLLFFNISKTSALLCFRPVLYGLCLFVLFIKKEEIKTEIAIEEQETETNVETEVFIKNKEAEIKRDVSHAYELFRQEGLTKRETEIALLICRGCSNREIAEELIISETTVKKHISNIFEKTGIEKREELKRYYK